jgi:hypothetical protein
MIDRLKAALAGDSADCSHEHPTLTEVGGCIDAWICYQEREEQPDGTVICGGCGRVLVHDTNAFKHDPDRMP